MSKAHPATSETQGHADHKPDTQNDKHRGEWNGTTRLLDPKKQVQQEEGREDNAWYQDWCKSDIAFPSLTAKCLVNPRRDITSNEAEDGVQQDHCAAKGTTIRGGEEAEESECDGGTNHDEKLGSIAEENTEQKGVLGSSEDVPVDELPARILLDVIFCMAICA